MELSDDRIVEESNAATGDGTHGQFFMAGHAKFPDDEDIQRSVQSRSNFVGDRDAAPRQSQNQHNRLIPVDLERPREETSSMCAILKLHGDREYRGECKEVNAPRCTKNDAVTRPSGRSGR